MGKKLYVGNLAFSVSSEALSELFSGYGNVESARLITDRDTGRSKGFGFVEMSTEDEAVKCIEQMNGKDFEGRAINVTEARPQEERGGARGGSGGGGRGFGGGGGRARY